MSGDDDAVIEAAEGPIDRDLLTAVGTGGIISTGYLKEKPLIEYLRDDETLHYLLYNLTKGLHVTRNGQTETIEPDDEYRTICAITSQRILFLIGQNDENRIVEVLMELITDIDLSMGLLKDKLHIETEDGGIDFYTQKECATVEATDYLERVYEQHREAGPPSTEDEEEETETSEKSTAKGTTTTEGSGEHTEISSQITRYIADRELVSDSVVETLDRAEELREGADNPSVALDELSALRGELIEAHQLFCTSVTNGSQAALDDDELEKTITKLEEQIDALQTVEQHLEEIDSYVSTTEFEWLFSDDNNSSNVPDQETLTLIEKKLEAAVQIAASTGLTLKPLTRARERIDDLDHTRKAELLEEFETVMDELGRVPSYADMREYGQFDAREYTDAFGSWQEVLNAANIDMEARLIEVFRTVADDLGRPPTPAEIDEKGRYESTRYDAYFDDWDTVIAAANLEPPDRTELLEDIHRLHDELGRIPDTSDIESHGRYALLQYRDEFGSIEETISAADLDLRGEIIEHLQQITAELGRTPKVSDFKTESPHETSIFEEQTPYEDRFVYEVFDGWEEALEAAEVATPEDAQAFLDDDSGTPPDPNPVAEHYDSFNTLRSIHRALFDPPISDTADEEPPMDQWIELIDEQVTREESDDKSAGYGAQQREQNEFSMRDYRVAHGDGTQVTEYHSMTVRPVPASVKRLLEDADADPEKTAGKLPVAPISDEPLPVIVDSVAALNRARTLLAEFPSEPQAAVTTPKAETEPEERSTSTDHKVSETEDQLTAEDKDPETASDAVTSTNDVSGVIDELTEVGGVSPSIAETLLEHGYDSYEALRAASIDELSELPGIGQMKAARIKADVGE